MTGVVAKYLRLSSEDSDLQEAGKYESNSITNQRTLINAYIDSNDDLYGCHVVEFCDDGWSGKNFNRPAVSKLLDDVQHGKIQCIVVKDLSRFGRDYLTVGNYITRVFPFLGVRFIAINDGFDSIRSTDIDSMETSFKTLIYDYYSRDLSRKVRSGRSASAKKGHYMGCIAPYGYQKTAEGRGLVADPNAANVIRRIYTLACEGTTPTEIANILNEEAVPTPMVYAKQNGCKKKNWYSIGESNYWTNKTVVNIISNEVYLGTLIYGKRARIQVGQRSRRCQNRKDWIITDNAHEALVSKEEFDQAQLVIRVQNRNGSTNHDRPLKGKVTCGVCGHRMRYIDEKVPCYYCHTPKLTSAYDCTTEKIPEAVILDEVAAALRVEAEYAVDLKQLMGEIVAQSSSKLSALQENLSTLKEQVDQLNQQKKALFEDWAQGAISDELFRSRKESINKSRDEWTQRIQELEKKIAAIDDNRNENNDYLHSFSKYTNISVLSLEIATDVLYEVQVFPNRRLEIIWNHRSAREQLIKSLQDAYGLDCPA